jgi:hypothetical protein
MHAYRKKQAALLEETGGGGGGEGMLYGAGMLRDELYYFFLCRL